MEQMLFERGYAGRDFEHDNHSNNSTMGGSVVFHISAKDTLCLLQMLLRWITGGASRGGGGSSST